MKVDWRSRPAKHVERLMIAESLGRLQSIQALKRYRYVGFGALHFIDFEVFHQQLGIEDMISIEHDTSQPNRYQFNRPFRTVEVLMGESRQILPQLDWSNLNIVWLDYDSMLTSDVLVDIRYLGRRLIHGSALIVTVSATAPLSGRLQALQTNVDPSLIAPGLTEESITPPWALADEQYRIIGSEFAAAVGGRTDGATPRQILNFTYKDNARMQTVGWLIDSPGVERALNFCNFEQLSFVRAGSEAYDLTVPQFTRRELAALRQEVPSNAASPLTWIGDEDFKSFADLYRWYPEI